jgi:hypothetical protein
MIAMGLLFIRLLSDRFKPRQQLETEILVLRHQLNILQRRAPGRPHLRWVDRALFVWLYRRCSVGRDFVDSTCLGLCSLPPRGHHALLPRSVMRAGLSFGSPKLRHGSQHKGADKLVLYLSEVQPWC